MSLEDLEQALFAAKWGDAEENATEVISRALQLPVGAVERVLYAADCAREYTQRKFTQLSASMDDGASLPQELRRAIEDAVDTGLKRAAVRYTIQNDYKLHVKPIKLVGSRVGDICNGCPHSIECVMHDVSTPEKCVKRGVLRAIRREGERYVDERRLCIVTPLKLVGDKVTVTCDQPTGTWTLGLEDFDLL